MTNETYTPSKLTAEQLGYEPFQPPHRLSDQCIEKARTRMISNLVDPHEPGRLDPETATPLNALVAYIALLDPDDSTLYSIALLTQDWPDETPLLRSEDLPDDFDPAVEQAVENALFTMSTAALLQGLTEMARVRQEASS